MRIGVVVALAGSLAGSVGLAGLAAASEEARRVWVDPPAVLQPAPGAGVVKDALPPATAETAAITKPAVQQASSEVAVSTGPAAQRAYADPVVSTEPAAQQAASSQGVQPASTPEALPDDEAPPVAAPPPARADFRAKHAGPPQALPAPVYAAALPKTRKLSSPDRLGILGGFAPYTRAQAAQPAEPTGERLGRAASQAQGALVRVRVIHFRKGRVLAVYTRS